MLGKLSKVKGRTYLGLVIGLYALAIAGPATVRAEEGQEANAAATDARASTAAAAETPAAPEAASSASSGEVTPLKEVEVRPAARPAAPDPTRPYFVEFRARAALSYGHTFLVHGRVGDPITPKSVVGLHPAERPGDETPWMIGHFIAVPSETGWSDGDVGYNDKYIIAKYRVYLTEAEYRVVLAKMRQMQRSTPLWHAVIYNCNAFVGDIARYMGLQAPLSHWLMPKDYINGIRQASGGRTQLASNWLASANPAAARQQAQQVARHESAPDARPQAASEARQQAGLSPAASGSRRQQHAAARSPQPPPAADTRPPPYANAQ
jgi:hypothetical protein